MELLIHCTRRRLAACLVAGALAVFGCASTPDSDALARYQRQALAAKPSEDRPKEPETLEEKVHSGDQLLDRGDIERSLMSYLDAVRLDPSASLPRERIGYLQLGHDPERAHAIFVDLVEQHPESASARRGLGLAFLGLGQMERAEVALKEALELEPDSAHSHYALAVAASLQGRNEEALPHNLRAMELRPRDATFANGLGVTHLFLGNFGLAEAAFRDAVRLAPRIQAYANNLGLSLGRQERYGEALEMFRHWGSEQAALNNLGYVYFLNGRYAEAAVQYERALQKDGDQKPQILRNLRVAVEARDRPLVSRQVEASEP